MNLDILNNSQKEVILNMIEDFSDIFNTKNLNEINFTSINTKNIELIIGQEEFIYLSMICRKEELKNYNVISIYEPEETILPLELYENFNNYLITKFSDIRRDIKDLYLNKKISKEEFDLLIDKEINEKEFNNIIDFINNNKNNKFIINCHAGISRSSAIAYILEDILNISEEEKKTEQHKILSHWRYCPNKIIIEKYLDLHNIS